MKRVFCLLLGCLALNLTASATGLIIIHEEDFWRRPPPRVVPPESIPPRPPYVPPRPPAWAALETSFTKADVRIKDQLATTSIEQEFYNPNARQLEGTFLFPVPKGAQINKFTMEINGKPVEAELLAADKARGIYEDIVRKLKDPALLEYAGRDLFKVRIFPIEANNRKRITLSYSQLLKADSGLVNFVLPFNTDKFSAKPVKNVSLRIDLETKRPLKSIYSPSHKVEIKRSGGNKATVGYEASDVKPDADFQLFFAQDQDDLGLNLLTYKTSGEDGYFLLLASPGAELKNNRVIPKDVMFVLDTSGSMAGAKLEQAKKALAFCVENLNDSDRFEVLRFATEVESLFDKLVEVSKDTRSKAQSFIKDLRPIGGTAIDDALKKALAQRPEKGDRPYIVIFLTDGRPTVGNTKEDDIVANVTRTSQGNVRVFCFGIGHDVNTHMLDKITEETRAVSQYVLPEEDIEVKVSSFFSKIKEPVLASPKISFPDSVRVTKLYPSPVPDIFKGEQLVLAGRYSGKGDGAIQIEGMVNGETKKFAYDVKFADEGNDHEFIPRLWATRRVGYLLDEIRLRGENKELKDEVVELARKYSIVTPYTAYLITEDETRRGVAHNARTLRFENEVRLQEARDNYSYFMKDKGGERGVASARSYSSLKAANAPADAISLGNVEALQAAPQAAPVQQPGSVASTRRPGVIASKKVIAEETARQYAAQSRFAGGKTFFQNEAQWVDADAQNFEKAKRVRVQFGSPEYFELQKKHPKAQAWLAVANNLQFVLAGTVYEIYE
jgi:Ca-activated chloride channel family protein